MYEAGVVFCGAHEGRVDGVSHERGHGVSDFEITTGHWFAVLGERQVADRPTQVDASLDGQRRRIQVVERPRVAARDEARAVRKRITAEPATALFTVPFIFTPIFWELAWFTYPAVRRVFRRAIGRPEEGG